MNLFQILKNIRFRTRPKQLYAVEVQVWGEHVKRYIAKLNFTTHAHSKAHARSNIIDALRLHVTDAWVVKEKVNGSK